MAAVPPPPLLIDHMDMYNIASESSEMIDSHARMPGGPTWKTMRDARNLPEEVQATHDQEEIGPQSDAENRRLRELIDALSAVSIEQDTEGLEAPPIVTSIWKHRAYPHAASSHQGDGDMDYFPRMIRAGLWLPHGETYNGIAS